MPFPAIRSLSATAGLALFLLPVATSFAQGIENPGFESGRDGWSDADRSGSGTAITNVANNGDRAVKLLEAST